MSLVYEALQKAEREKERKVAAPLTAAQPVRQKKPVVIDQAPAPVAAPVEERKSMNNFLTMLIVCVSVVALAAIVYIVMVAARSLTQAPVAAVPSATAAAPVTAVSPPVAEHIKEPPALPATPAANSTANDSRFKLTGVMITDGHFGAVLNDHIVYDGQYVDGAIVKKVERDRVTLTVDGRDIVIRLF